MIFVDIIQQIVCPETAKSESIAYNGKRNSLVCAAGWTKSIFTENKWHNDENSGTPHIKKHYKIILGGQLPCVKVHVVFNNVNPIPIETYYLEYVCQVCEAVRDVCAWVPFSKPSTLSAAGIRYLLLGSSGFLSLAQFLDLQIPDTNTKT